MACPESDHHHRSPTDADHTSHPPPCHHNTRREGDPLNASPASRPYRHCLARVNLRRIRGRTFGLADRVQGVHLLKSTGDSHPWRVAARHHGTTLPPRAQDHRLCRMTVMLPGRIVDVEQSARAE